MSRLLAPSLSALAASALIASAAAQNLGVALSNQIDGYIEVPYSQLVVPQSGITFEAWITYDDATIPASWRYPTIVRQGVSVGGSEDYFLRVEAGNTAARVLRWKVVTALGSPTVSWSFSAGQLSTWTHVAATYDGTTAALYINGVQVGTAAASGAAIRDLNNEVLRIGKGSDVATPIEVWNGQIDEVRLWPFARTQAEIQATMNMELGAIPGVVSTWNLNGNYLDTSGGGQHATSSGQVTFTPNTLNLTPPVVQAAFPFGASTPGCLGPIAISLTSLAQVGNAAFAPVCTRAPANAIAFLMTSFQPLPAPLQVAGVNVWLNPVPSVLSLASVNGLGAARCGLPLPVTAPLGLGLNFQFALLDACGPQGITASSAMTVVLQ
jgi:hypothetical protein